MTDLKTIVLCHDITSNALGRALSMALVARELGSVEVWALGSGEIWKGAVQFPFVVKRISSSSARRALAEASDAADGRLLVWVCKGISPLPRLVRSVRALQPNASILLDFDDDDAGLARGYRERSWLRRLKLNRFRRMHPARIRAAQSACLRYADGVTFATETLRRSLHLGREGVLIPHTREPGEERASSPGGDRDRPIRVGAFGTIREHKGKDLLLQLVDTYPDIELVTFAGCGMGSPTSAQENWREIDGRTSLATAYGLVDVAAIVIDARAPGANAQLPAKLIDAMRSGVPIVATSTDAIEEIAGESIVPLDREASVSQLHAAIRASVARRSDGGAVRELFMNTLSPAPLAARLDDYLTSGIVRRSDRPRKGLPQP